MSPEPTRCVVHLDVHHIAILASFSALELRIANYTLMPCQYLFHFKVRGSTHSTLTDPGDLLGSEDGYEDPFFAREVDMGGLIRTGTVPLQKEASDAVVPNIFQDHRFFLCSHQNHFLHRHFFLLALQVPWVPVETLLAIVSFSSSFIYQVWQPPTNCSP